MAEDLVKGEGFAVDASIVAADPNRQRGVPSTETVNWKNRALSTRAVREYLEALDADEVKKVLPRNIQVQRGHQAIAVVAGWGGRRRLS